MVLDYIKYLLIPLLAFMDRWGGGGFAHLPKPFNKGIKAVRRFGIPAIMFLYSISYQQAFFAGVLALILCSNLDEIEDQEFDTIGLYAFSLAMCFWPMSGWWSMGVAAWWIAGLWLSNEGIAIGKFKWKLDWMWVEFVRGALIGLALVM